VPTETSPRPGVPSNFWLSDHESSTGGRRGARTARAMLVLRGRQPKGDLLPHVHPSRPPAPPRRWRQIAGARGEHPGSGGGGRRAAPHGRRKGDGVMATRPFARRDRDGRLLGRGLTGNDSHATQVVPAAGRSTAAWDRRSNHPATPTAVSGLNDGQAFDFVARQPISAGQELTFDYAMRKLHDRPLPGRVPVRRPRGCRGSVTGWKDLPAARKADYGELVAPYLRTIDDEIGEGPRRSAASDRQVTDVDRGGCRCRALRGSSRSSVSGRWARYGCSTGCGRLGSTSRSQGLGPGGSRTECRGCRSR